MRRTRVFAPLALLAALLLAGCGEDPAEFSTPESAPADTQPSADAQRAADDDPSSQQADDETTGAGQGADDGTSTQEEGTDGDGPGADSDDTSGPTTAQGVDPQDVVAQTTYPMTASDVDGGTITVGVHELRVDGETMLLTLYFTPEFDGDDRLNLFQMHGYSQLSPVLNDRANLKQYTVLDDDESGAWSTNVGPAAVSAGSGETLVWWGYYAAPEDDIDTIAVSVFSGAAELDVRIDR